MRLGHQQKVTGLDMYVWGDEYKTMATVQWVPQFVQIDISSYKNSASIFYYPTHTFWCDIFSSIFYTIFSQTEGVKLKLGLR